jgi:hypothetical protein
MLSTGKFGVGLTGLLLTGSGMAATVFSDGTFDLSNYTVTNYQTGGGTINTAQMTSGGNPGDALETIINGPASTSYQATSFAINNAFAYDPTVSGAIASLSFSADRELNFNGTPLSVAGISSIIEQAGDFYRFVAPITTTQGVYQTGSKAGVLATDYNLITNPTTGAVDTWRAPGSWGCAIQGDSLLAGGGDPDTSVRTVHVNRR